MPSLFRICNACNVFSLPLFQDIPSYSQIIVPVWQYNSHFTTKQPFHPLSPILYKQAIPASFVKTFTFVATYNQAQLFGCVSTLCNHFFYCCLTAFSQLGCVYFVLTIVPLLLLTAFLTNFSCLQYQNKKVGIFGAGREGQGYTITIMNIQRGQHKACIVVINNVSLFEKLTRFDMLFSSNDQHTLHESYTKVA